MATLPPFLTWNQSLDLSDYSEFDKAYKVDRYIEEEGGKQLRAQVVVEESGSDELQITDHPVQQGAVISDHAVRRPAEVRIRMGWSAAYLVESGGEGDVKGIYDRVLKLQASRKPFTIYTGKRIYENMLVASIQVTTNARMEYTFLADIAFREVLLVGTSVSLGGSWLYSGYELSRPDKNAFTIQSGTMQVKDAKVSDTQWGAATGNQGSDLEQGVTLPSATTILPTDMQPLIPFAFRRMENARP